MKTLLHQLYDFGQSPWLDYISRKILDNGHLQRMIDKGIVGVTSNPTIFDKAVHTGHDYDPIIRELAQKGKTKEEICDNITIRDIQDACDLFLPVYQQTGNKDGYVSLEVNPNLAYDTDGTIQEAEKLFQLVNRSNLLIKVPATEEGFPAIETLLSQGINVNITLIFSREQYIKSVRAYLNGIEKAHFKRKDISKIASVASVFVSRVDGKIDSILEKQMNQEDSPMQKSELKDLLGKAAIANGHLIYQEYRGGIFALTRFQELAAEGANIQRVLWASTSTKNPDYSDIKYVQELIARNTVNTMPEDTIEAFLDHGKVENAISDESSRDQLVLSHLDDRGILIDEACQQLLTDGVKKFIDSHNSLLDSIEQKRKLFQ
jgi:transaldolase